MKTRIFPSGENSLECNTGRIFLITLTISWFLVHRPRCSPDISHSAALTSHLSQLHSRQQIRRRASTHLTIPPPNHPAHWLFSPETEPPQHSLQANTCRNFAVLSNLSLVVDWRSVRSVNTFALSSPTSRLFRIFSSFHMRSGTPVTLEMSTTFPVDPTPSASSISRVWSSRTLLSAAMGASWPHRGLLAKQNHHCGHECIVFCTVPLLLTVHCKLRAASCMLPAAFSLPFSVRVTALSSQLTRWWDETWNTWEEKNQVATNDLIVKACKQNAWNQGLHLGHWNRSLKTKNTLQLPPGSECHFLWENHTWRKTKCRFSMLTCFNSIGSDHNWSNKKKNRTPLPTRTSLHRWLFRYHWYFIGHRSHSNKTTMFCKPALQSPPSSFELGKSLNQWTVWSLNIWRSSLRLPAIPNST